MSLNYKRRVYQFISMNPQQLIMYKDVHVHQYVPVKHWSDFRAKIKSLISQLHIIHLNHMPH